MTNEGEMYFFPDQLSNWFVYKDGQMCFTSSALAFQGLHHRCNASSPQLRSIPKINSKGHAGLMPGKDSM